MSKKKKIALISIGCASIAIIGLFFFTLDSYVACGCGCCGGVKPSISFTFNPMEIITADENISSEVDCRTVGCSFGKKYYFFNFKK